MFQSTKTPFNTKIDPNAEEAEELVELKVSKAMKLEFNNKTNSFLLSLHDSYPLLSKKASIILVQFATTYLCEAGFSDLAPITAKSKNRLNSSIGCVISRGFRRSGGGSGGDVSNSM